MADLTRIFTSPFLLVGLDELASASMVTAVRDVALTGGTADQILAILTSAGLAEAPMFFCAEVVDSDVRILIRGDVAVDVRRPDDGMDRLTAGRSGTWRDDVISEVESLVLSVNGLDVEWRPISQRSSDGDDAVRGSAGTETASEAVDPHDRALADDEMDVHLTIGPETEPDSPWEPERASEPEPATEPPEDDGSPSPDVATLAEVPAPPPPVASAPASVDGESFDFSNLLESTMFRDVEAAAVRESTDAVTDDEPTEHQSTKSEPQDDPIPTPVVVPPPAPVIPSVGGPGIIAAIPGTMPPAQDDADDAWSGLGDHDGHTVALSSLRDSTPTDGGDGHRLVGSEVRAIVCPAAHANPPTATMCRICGSHIVDRTVHAVPRPVLARLQFSTGLVVDVDRPQVIGRRPTAEDYAESTEIPNLVTLASPDSDISRNHAVIRVEGWNLLVEDQGSTNGTEVRLPGQEIQRLRDHSPVLVVPETMVVLAGTVSFTIEVPR